MCHVNATLKCVLLFETWFVVIASSSSFSQLLFLGCQPGCYRLLNLFTLEITNLKCGRDKVVNTKYTIHIPYELESHNILYSILWQYGLLSFQAGYTKLEIFLPKNQHTQRKLLNFENWVNGEVSKSAKF